MPMLLAMTSVAANFGRPAHGNRFTEEAKRHAFHALTVLGQRTYNRLRTGVVLLPRGALPSPEVLTRQYESVRDRSCTVYAVFLADFICGGTLFIATCFAC